MIRLRSNWREFERELDRLEQVPTKASLAMDTIFHKGFAETQAIVHVVTGSLKSSGRAETEFDGDTWRGTISYGGVSFGIRNPVTYAIYEKARDEDHDFFVPLKALDSLYVKAILKALS